MRTAATIAIDIFILFSRTYYSNPATVLSVVSWQDDTGDAATWWRQQSKVCPFGWHRLSLPSLYLENLLHELAVLCSAVPGVNHTSNRAAYGSPQSPSYIVKVSVREEQLVEGCRTIQPIHLIAQRAN